MKRKTCFEVFFAGGFKAVKKFAYVGKRLNFFCLVNIQKFKASAAKKEIKLVFIAYVLTDITGKIIVVSVAKIITEKVAHHAKPL